MPTYPDLLAYVRQFVTMPPESWRAAEAKCRPRHLRPGQWLLAPGQACSQTGFLRRGILHFFTPEGDMDRSLLQLEGPAFFTCPDNGPQDREGSPYGVEALSDVEMVMMARTDWHMLTELCMPWQRFRDRIRQEMPAVLRPNHAAIESGVAFNASMLGGWPKQADAGSSPASPQLNGNRPSL